MRWWPPKASLPLCCVVVSLCLVVHADGDNVALRKPVYAKAHWPQDLVDGDPETSINPHAGPFPVVVVDLLHVYRLNSVHVHAQNEEVYGSIGLNVPFSVYTWDKLFSPCDLEKDYPWKKLQAGLTFTQQGQKLVLNGTVEARYIIILPDITNPLAEEAWLPLGEVMAFGEKIKDGFNPASMDDGETVPEMYTETRNQLLQGQDKLLVQMSFVDYRLNSKYTDVPVTWYIDRITTMAAIREKARLIFMSGRKSLQHMLNSSDYARLRENFRTWLNPNNHNANFVSVGGTIEDGDILVITRSDKFDVDDIAKRLKEGRNSAVVSYLAGRHFKKNRVSRLMKKLEVIAEPSTINYGMVEHNVSEFINNKKGLPDDFEFQVALRSWKQFRTQQLDFNRLGKSARRSSWFQSKVREILEKYHDYYTYYAPCSESSRPGSPNLNGVLNYNRLLLLQEGSTIIPAPGVWSAPGNILHSVKPVNMTVRVTSDVLNRFVPIGAYAKPGVAFRYKVLHSAKTPIYQYLVYVNPQLDQVSGSEASKRWPIVTKKEQLEEEGETVSPFGGPIALTLGEGANLTIRLENVYRYPWFDVRNPESVNNWETERSKYMGVPYGIVAGDNMFSMLDGATLTQMDKDTILWATRYYDNIIKMIHNYRGSKFEEAHHEVFISDVALSNGKAHSGLPWMGVREVAKLYGDLEYIKKGLNTVYPEMLGHNLAVQGMRCKNGGSVIGTVYISVVHKYLLGLDSYERGSDPGCTEADETRMIKTWNDGEYRGLDLSYYNYLGRLFGPGLLGNVIPKVLKRKYCPNVDEETTNLWVKHMCTESKYDLVPFHRLWHFNIRPETIEHCSGFPCALPDDELTRQAPELVEKILKEHNKTCMRGNFTKVEFKMDPMRGMNTTRSPMVLISNE